MRLAEWEGGSTDVRLTDTGERSSCGDTAMSEENGTCKVRLTLTSRQDYRGSGQGLMQSADTYTAVYRWDGSRHVLCYEESDPESGAVTAVRMTIAEDRMVIERKGAVRATIELEPEQDRICRYETPFGVIPMTFRTTKLTVSSSNRAGGTDLTARAFYSIRQEGTEAVRCAVTVRVQAAE